MNMRSMTSSIMLLMVTVLSVGCDDEPVGECAGDITVTVRLSSVRAKLLIVWDGDVVVDECVPVSAVPILFEKKETELVINDGGFGFTPADAVSVTVNDLKDCIQPPEPLIAVENE